MKEDKPCKNHFEMHIRRYILSPKSAIWIFKCESDCGNRMENAKHSKNDILEKQQIIGWIDGKWEKWFMLGWFILGSL